eukprot:snap_masked-scaffold_11-processed-gene-0.27-mRNA-1 protein AED:1.00 eAED:1.00 QI:0/0/0/0/1/1/2/0/76
MTKVLEYCELKHLTSERCLFVKKKRREDRARLIIFLYITCLMQMIEMMPNSLNKKYDKSFKSRVFLKLKFSFGLGM